MTVTYVTSQQGFEAAYRLTIQAWDISRRLIRDGHTIMLRTVYDDGLTHVIVDTPGERIGDWTYNNRGRSQELFPRT